MIILRGVNLFPTQIEELIMGIPALSPHFQLHLTREGRMDQLAVHVERRPGTPDSASAEAGVTLSAMVKNTIGVTISDQRDGPRSPSSGRWARCAASSITGRAERLCQMYLLVRY